MKGIFKLLLVAVNWHRQSRKQKIILEKVPRKVWDNKKYIIGDLLVRIFD